MLARLAQRCLPYCRRVAHVATESVIALRRDWRVRKVHAQNRESSLSGPPPAGAAHHEQRHHPRRGPVRRRHREGPGGGPHRQVCGLLCRGCLQGRDAADRQAAGQLPGRGQLMCVAMQHPQRCPGCGSGCQAACKGALSADVGPPTSLPLLTRNHPPGQTTTWPPPSTSSAGAFPPPSRRGGRHTAPGCDPVVCTGEQAPLQLATPSLPLSPTRGVPTSLLVARA